MSIQTRKRVEREIAQVTIKCLLDAGFLLGVNDGEETTIHHSRDAAAIEAAMFTTDEDWLLVYVKGDNVQDPRPQYWVRFIYGNDGWDVIRDYTTYLEPWMGNGTAVDTKIKEYQG
jgi:hypothetical protein